MTPLFENELYLAQDHLDKKIQHEQLQIAAAKKGKNHKKRERKELGCHAPPPFRPTIPAIAITPAPPSTGHHSTTITAITATPPAAPKESVPTLPQSSPNMKNTLPPPFPPPQPPAGRRPPLKSPPPEPTPRPRSPSQPSPVMMTPPMNSRLCKAHRKRKGHRRQAPSSPKTPQALPPTPPNVSSPPRRRHPSPMTLNDCIEPCSLAYERYYSTASPSEH